MKMFCNRPRSILRKCLPVLVLSVGFLCVGIPLFSQNRSHLLDSLEKRLLNEKDNQIKVDVLNMLGRLYTDRDMEVGKRLLYKSISIGDSIHYDWGVAQACKYMGFIYDYQAYNDVSNNYFQRAIKIMENCKEERCIGEKYFLLSYPAGRIYLAPLTKQFGVPRDTTIHYLERCLAIQKKLNNHLGMADCYDRLGFEHWDKGYYSKKKEDFLKSFNSYLMAKNEYAKISFQDGVAMSMGKLAVAYYFLGDSLSSYKYYKIAFRLNEAIGNKMFMARNLGNIAETHLVFKRLDSAKILYKQVLEWSTSLQYFAFVNRVPEALAKIYELEGDYKMASKYYYDLYKSQDLHFRQEHLTTSIEIQSRYENQIKVNQIKRLELENKLKEEDIKNEYLIIIFLVIVVATIIVSAYIILRNRRKYLMKINAIEISHRVKQEKDRISKDLHDNIGTQLTSLSLSLNNLERKNNVDRPIVELLQKDLHVVMAELRDTIWAINKEEITLEEFGDKVKNLFWRFQQHNGLMNCSVIFWAGNKDRILKSSQAINLFRILQETIANSLKHSGGNQLTVTISDTLNQSLKIDIADNGCGFDAQHHFNGEHCGLRNIRKRAEEMSARLTIISEPEKGTVVTVSLPMPN